MAERLGILASHPIQYYAPWFRDLARRQDLEVYYAHRQDSEGQSRAGFNVAFDWDVALLDGYSYRFLKNAARYPGLDSFHGCDTPEIDEIIRAGRFGAFVVFGWNRKSSLQAIAACRRNGVPVLMRGDSQLTTRRSSMKLLVKYLPYRWFLPKINAHLYVGQRNKEYLRHYGVPDSRLFFAPHFVDNKFFSRLAHKAEKNGQPKAIRARFGIPENAFLFLFVGKLIPKKRAADLVQACEVVSRVSHGPNIHVLFVGDGPQRTEFEESIRRSRDRIHFAGFRNQSEVPAFYSAANALVLPSDGAETWGLVVNEAFACGIPALVSAACGCAPDLIEEGLTGFSYPVGDVGALADRMLALKRLVEMRCGTVRQAVEDKARCYSIEKATDGLESALQSVMYRNKEV